MSHAYKDENGVSTLIASSSVDGFTPVRLVADPDTHRLLVDIDNVPTTPGEPDKSLQFNSNGNFGGDEALTYDIDTRRLNVGIEGGGFSIFGNDAVTPDVGGVSVQVEGGSGLGIGSGGGLSFVGGNGGENGGNGGTILFNGGNANGGDANGGSIRFVGGNPNGVGKGGGISFSDAAVINIMVVGGTVLGLAVDNPGVTSTGNFAYFDTEPMTADRLFAFPDQSGTFAIQSTATGSFTTADAKTVTVTFGIITDIS